MELLLSWAMAMATVRTSTNPDAVPLYSSGDEDDGELDMSVLFKDDPEHDGEKPLFASLPRPPEFTDGVQCLDDETLMRCADLCVHAMTATHLIASQPCLVKTCCLAGPLARSIGQLEALQRRRPSPGGLA